MVGNILGGCLLESLLTIWRSSLQEDARAIHSVQGIHLAVFTSFETLCFACLFKSLKIVNFVFIHFLSACCLSLLAIESFSLIDSNHGEEVWTMTFRREGGACLSSTECNWSQNWFAFSADENWKILESSAINVGWSMFAMFLTVQHKTWWLKT